MHHVTIEEQTGRRPSGRTGLNAITPAQARPRAHAIYHRARLGTAFALAGGLASCALAQTTAPESPSGREAVISLEKFVAEGTVADDSVLPTVRPISSVLGRAGNVLDAPRGVSTITKGQLEERNVQRIEDLSQFIPGAFTAPVFGNAGVPTIRGDLGEAYQNGQRKAYNRNTFPVSFNGVESVDAIKGAAPAFFGYANATGGYINFVTKKPFFDRQRTTIRAVAGDWDSYRWQIDTSGPIGAKAAYRVSYEGSDADSFYRLVYNDSQSLYAALTFKPNERVTFDLNTEYMSAHFTENPGITRPTQDLIDHALYITGSSVQNGGTGSYFGNTFTPTGTVKIDGSQSLLAPGDEAFAKVWNAQGILSLDLGGGRLLKNSTYLETFEAEKHSSYYFYAWTPENHTAENRTELYCDFDAGTVSHKTISGISVRYEHNKSFVDIFNEWFNPFDVTQDPATLVYPRSRLYGVIPVPGKPYLALPGGTYPLPNGSKSVGFFTTRESDLGSAGVFLQDQVYLGSRWNLLLGARVDQLWVNSQDPLPLPGYAPAHDSIRATRPSGTASLVFKPTALSTLYLTLNRASAIDGHIGLGLSNNQLQPEAFRTYSELIEAGAKTSLLNERLFVGATAYYQRRNRTGFLSKLPDKIEVSGTEVEAVYQPNATVNFGANFTYSHASYLNGPEGGIQTVPTFSPTVPSGTFASFPKGNYRLPSLPLWLFNSYASYTHASGLGASFSFSAQGEQNLDLFGIVKIRDQHTWNIAVFLKRKKWELRADFLNLTDELNWQAPSSPFTGADLITRQLPFHQQVSFKYAF